MALWTGYALFLAGLAALCASIGFLYLLAQRVAKVDVPSTSALQVGHSESARWYGPGTTLWLWPWVTRTEHSWHTAPGTPIFVPTTDGVIMTLDMDTQTREGAHARFHLRAELELEADGWSEVPSWSHLARELYHLTREELSERSLHTLREERRTIAQSLVREFQFAAPGIRKIVIETPITFDAEIEEAFERELKASLEHRIDQARGIIPRSTVAERQPSDSATTPPKKSVLSDQDLQILETILGTDRATTLLMAGALQDAGTARASSPESPTPSQS